jgi:hypothetical protein
MLTVGAFSIVLPEKASVDFNADAFAALVLFLVLAAEKIADQIALDDGQPAVIVEIRH